jgi:hypothetical protein
MHTLLTLVLLSALLVSAPGFAQLRPESRKIPESTPWKESFAPIPDVGKRDDWGTHIQRTMGLLARSTPEKRNTVRILFYGQSIVGQKKWPDAVMHMLRKRYPHANILYDNRAIGGFSSQWLIHTSEHQLYPFQPDLLIFHVYGAHDDYQRIIHRVRSRTAAEVAIISDHLKATDYDGKTFAKEGRWTAFMQGFIKKVAGEYDCEFIEIREPWKAYLRDNGLEAGRLLKDNVHPNDHGGYLMSGLVERQLVYRPEQISKTSQALTVDRAVGSDVSWDQGKLRLEFEGNALALLGGRLGDAPAQLEIRIDGKKPSQMQSCYYHTLPSSTVGVGWPAIREVGNRTMPVEEDWTLTLTDFEYLGEGKDVQVHFNFSLVGSRTGPDGKGSSREDFISKSGRVLIAADDWVITRSYRFSKVKPPEKFEVAFSTRLLGADRFEPGVYDPNSDNLQLIVGLLPNARHVLELSGDPEKVRIEAIRVYRPAVTGKMELVDHPPAP